MIAEVFIFVEQKLESPYEYMKYKILNAPINYYPYPHISIENIFPQEFYDSLLENLPNIDEYTPKPKYVRNVKRKSLRKTQKTSDKKLCLDHFQRVYTPFV